MLIFGNIRRNCIRYINNINASSVMLNLLLKCYFYLFIFFTKFNLKTIINVFFFSINRVAQLTGYEPQELLHNTLYHYIHACDIHDMQIAHQICKSTNSFHSLFLIMAWLKQIK